MITPKLEEMIHNGIASSRTFCVGMSGNCVLDVPDNAYIVIHNIVYFPFYDSPEDFAGTYEADRLQRCNKQIEFKSAQTDNHFMVRDSGLFVLMPINIDCYLVHFSDVAISFLKQPPIAPANLTFQASAITDTVSRAPSGYGALDAVRQANLQAGAQMYLPANSKNTPLVVPTNQYRGEYKLSHNLQTQLFDPSVLLPPDTFIDRSLPLMNVQYVLIQKEPTDKIQASS